MKWHRTIEAFFERCVDFIEQGLDIELLCDQAKGQDVHWRGQIKALELDKEYSKGIRLYTLIQDRHIQTGKFITFPSVRLVTTDESLQSWSACKVGDIVEFSAKIQGSGPFQCIKVLEFKDSDKIMLNVSLHDAYCVNNHVER